MNPALFEGIVRARWLIGLLILSGVVASFFAMRAAPLDAIPDTSDPQVIVYAKWARSPELLEEQVTEPIVKALLGSPADTRWWLAGSIRRDEWNGGNAAEMHVEDAALA